MERSYGEFEMNATIASADPELYDCNPVSFYWIAQCGDNLTPRTNFNIGWQASSAEIVQDGEVQSTFVKPSFVIAPESGVDTMYIFMTSPADETFTGRTFIEPPALNVDYDLVYPVMTGEAVNGGWIDNERILDLTIEY